MSRYSGKCDLYDHIYMIHNDDKSPIECFNKFKELTKGVIYKNKRIKLTPYNIEKEILKYNKCDDTSFLNVAEEEIDEYLKKSLFFRVVYKKDIVDKRYKSGHKEVTTYEYYFWNKKFTEKEIFKIDFTTSVEIKFDSMLDLIEYYPYVIAMGSYSKDNQYIILAEDSYLEDRLESSLLYDSSYDEMYRHYKKELINCYIETAKYLESLGEINE